MDEIVFNVGDEVYVYKDFFEEIKKGNLIKGVVTEVEHYDYGYHGSGDWVWDYKVRGEDGKEYSANYKHGYKPYSIATKEDIIEYITRKINFLEERKIEVVKELDAESIELNKALEIFINGKGQQYKKGSR